MSFEDAKKWWHYFRDLWISHPNSRWIFIVFVFFLILYYSLRKIDLLINKKIEIYAETTKDNAAGNHYLTKVPSRATVETLYRDKYIKAINPSFKRQRYLINGIGGIGKTSVAIEAFFNIEKKYDYVAWINCTQGESLEICFLESLTLFSDIRDSSLRIKKVENFLSNTKKKILIVIDDLRQDMFEDRFLEFILSTKVTLLVTSRMPGLPLFYTVTVEPLEKEQCVSLFCHYYSNEVDHKDLPIIEELVQEVSKHTLSIELLAKSVPPGMSLSDYRHKLKKKGFGFPKLKIASMHDKEMRTISEHLRKLYEISSLSAEQKQILQVFAILPNEEIPFKICDWIHADINDLFFLVHKGWINKTEGGYLLHDIVRKVILFDPVDEKQVSIFIDTIGNNEFFNSNDSFVTYHLKERIALSILQHTVCSKITVEAYKRTAKASMWNGHYSTSITLFEKVLPIYERKYGEESPPYQDILRSLMIAFGDMKNYDKAVQKGELLLNIQTNSTLKNEIEIAKTQNYLAFFKMKSKQVEAAIDLGNTSLEGLERNLSEDDVEIAIAHCFLGMAYCRKKEYNYALFHHRKAYQIFVKKYGYKHPRTSSVITGVGDIYYGKGDFRNALKWHLEAYCIDKEKMGENHPFTLIHYESIKKDYMALNAGKERHFENWVSKKVKKHRVKEVDLKILESDAFSF